VGGRERERERERGRERERVQINTGERMQGIVSIVGEERKK